jgi:hypothetical protein
VTPETSVDRAEISTVDSSDPERKEVLLHPELHSRFASERLKDDHGTRPDDPTDESLVEVGDDSALPPRPVPPDADDEIRADQLRAAA